MAVKTSTTTSTAALVIAFGATGIAAAIGFGYWQYGRLNALERRLPHASQLERQLQAGSMPGDAKAPMPPYDE